MIKIQCLKCLPEEGIECPDFSLSEKNKLSKMVKNNYLNSIVYLKEQYRLSLHDAKYIVMHINETDGQCNRCNFDHLTGEYTQCPKCGAFNFNWLLNNK